MLEGRIAQGALLKKVFDAIKEMVPEVNLECGSDGIQLQAMDNSHVALVSLQLNSRAFESYLCERGRCLGLNMAAVAKVFKLCGNDDGVLIRHHDDGDTISFVFEAHSEFIQKSLIEKLQFCVRYIFDVAWETEIDHVRTIRIPISWNQPTASLCSDSFFCCYR